MHPLHDNHERAGPLVVEAGQQCVFEPFVGCIALGLGIGVVRLQRIVDDDDLPAAARQGAADRGRQSEPPRGQLDLDLDLDSNPFAQSAFANKGGPENDFSVCTTWFVTRDRRWYLLDVLRKRVDYPALKAAVQSHAALWKAQRVLIEDAGAGTALFQELRGKVSGIVEIKPDRDKITRMAAVSSKFESGLAFLPKSAPWLVDFEAELFAFPGAKHDDQCDSVSQALWNVRFPIEISDAALAAMARFARNGGLYGQIGHRRF